MDITTHSHKKIGTFIILGTLICVIAIGFFSSQNTLQAQETSSQSKPTAIAAPVAPIATQPIHIVNTFSGRLVAVNKVDIKPQVSGQIKAIHFQDGQMVKQGELLITIEPRPFEAAVKRAQAQLETAKSRKKLAQLDYDRAKELAHTNAIAQRTLNERESQLTIAKNAILSAEADLIQAEVNLDHALIKAPIEGRVSRPELTVGNLVQAGPGAPILTSIVSMDQIYAEFDIDDQTYLTYVHDTVKSGLDDNKIRLQLTISGSDTPYSGYIYSFDNQINPNTGTIRARGLFQNKDRNLLSGMFAQVHMSSPSQENHIVIPKEAIGIDQDRRYVYVLSEENTALYREVSLGKKIGDHFIVEKGLSPNDRIVVGSIGMIRANAVLDPQFTHIDLSQEH